MQEEFYGSHQRDDFNFDRQEDSIRMTHPDYNCHFDVKSYVSDDFHQQSFELYSRPTYKRQRLDGSAASGEQPASVFVERETMSHSGVSLNSSNNFAKPRDRKN